MPTPTSNPALGSAAFRRPPDIEELQCRIGLAPGSLPRRAGTSLRLEIVTGRGPL